LTASPNIKTYNIIYNCPTFYKKKHSDTTTLYQHFYTNNQVSHLKKTKAYNTVQNFTKTLHKHIQIIDTTLPMFTTHLQNDTQLYKTLQNLEKLIQYFTQLYTTLQNFTKLYNTFTKLYTTLHNSTQLYTTLHNSTQLYKTPQYLQTLCKFIQSFKIIQHFTKQLHKICTQPYTTLHIFTRLYTIVHMFKNYIQHYTNFKKKTIQYMCKTLRNFLQDLTKLFFYKKDFTTANTTIQKLPNFSKPYSSLHTKPIFTLQNLTNMQKGIYTPLHNFTELFKTLQNITQIYKQLCKSIHKNLYTNYTKLYTTIQDYSKLFKTIQNYTKLYKTIQN